jgi:FKBP-type peptidyl-prolyl cis-trans isomerase
MNFKYKTKTMKQSFYLAAAAMVLLASCQAPFKKAGEGLEYKIISDGKGKQIKAGQFFEIQFERSYKGNNKDTVLQNSKDASNQLVALDSAQIPPVYFKIFSQVRKGDSIIVKQITDSIMKRGGTPPFMKKGAYIIDRFKVVNIFETRDQAEAAYKNIMLAARAKDSLKAVEQLKKDDKVITDYLAKNKIQAVKAPEGTYVQIINPGEGEIPDSSKVYKVLYTGRLLGGTEVFDSNTDPAKGPSRPYPVHIASGGVIKGWLDGLSLLKKGAKAVFYIPSSLAYGPQAAGELIKPNSNLVFDIEIADVITTAQAKAESEAERKEMEAKRKQMMDSAQKAQKAQGGAQGAPQEQK